MAHKPTDWLGPLIEHEIQAALNWYKQTIGYPKVKKDPVPRFDDDGSNLRSEIEPSLLPKGNTAQIAKVLSTDDPLLLISDGVTLIRARFSSGALASLESEIGEAIDLETKGDVFSIRKCTVVTTPYGPTEGHVQLQIDEVEYHHHLRKIVGVASSAGQRPEIARLIGEVMRIRHPEPGAEPPAQQLQPKQNGRLRRGSHSDSFETQAVHTNPQSPASQASIALASSPPVTVSQSPKTQPQANTQIPAKRKRNAPNFSKDGVEMRMGVNLDRPMGANPSRPASNRAVTEQSKRAIVSASSAGLLDLLEKQQVKSEEQAETPVAPDRISPQGIQPISPEQHSSARKGASQQEASFGGVRNATLGSEINQKARASQRPFRSARRPYWQRPIPVAQQRLLDSPASWLPALPGRQFPYPNVPMELLSKWNEQVEARPESVRLSQSVPNRSQDESTAIYAKNARPQETTSGSSEEDDSVSDEEIAWSSSPPRPAAAQGFPKTVNQQQSRPPESSNLDVQSSPYGSRSSEEFPSSPADSLSRPSTTEKRPDLPPDSSFENAVAPRALPTKRPDREDNSMPMRPVQRPSTPSQSSRTRPSASSQPFPRGGDSYRPNYSRPRSSERPQSPMEPSLPHHFSPNPSSSRALSRGSDRYRPPPPSARNPAATSPEQHNGATNPSAQRTENGASSVRPVRHVSQSPTQSNPPLMAPPSTATTVIKATQMGRPSDVHRARDGGPQSRDPILEHQQRRSEHFKGLQRRQWIKANYTPNPKKSFSMGALLSAYKKAHPRDQPRLSELAEAYRDVFPDEAEGDDGLSLGGEQAETNVPDTIIRLRASLADEEGLDTTPSKVLNRKSVQSTNERLEPTRRPGVDLVMHGSSALETTLSKSQQEREKIAQKSGPGRTTGVVAARERSDRGLKEHEVASILQPAEKMGPPTLPPKQSAPSASATSISAPGQGPDFRAWLKRQIEREQQSLRNEGATRRIGGAETSIKAFANAWQGVRPGGAFARKEERAQMQKTRVGGRLRVLEWEL